MESLKKVYTDMILNTSKEAASRIMEANRKALCSQHDLVSLKQESLHMLLRLKDTFNLKISQAEARSKNQQMKIDELEAQLSEAEEIIVDLRNELKHVQDKLEIKRKNQEKHLNGHRFCLEEPEIDLTVVYTKCSSVMNDTNLSITSNLDQNQAVYDDSTSIILRSTENDLYINGCTHKVCAFEEDCSDVKPSTSSTAFHPSPVTVQPDMRAVEADNSSSPSMLTERSGTAHQDQIHNVCTLQKCQKSKGNLNRNCVKILKTSSRESSVRSHCEPHLKVVDSNVKSGEEPCCVSDGLGGELLHDFSWYKDQSIRSLCRKNAKYREAIAILRRSSRRKSVKSLQQPPSPCPCKIRTCDLNLQSVEIPIGVAQSEPYKSIVCATAVSDDLTPGSKVKLNPNNIIASGERHKMICAAKGDLNLPDLKLVDVPVSKGFGCSDCPAGIENDKLPKFKFYRKRRKNALGIVDENIIPDKSTKKKRLEKPAEISLLENHGLKDELHGGSR